MKYATFRYIMCKVSQVSFSFEISSDNFIKQRTMLLLVNEFVVAACVPTRCGRVVMDNVVTISEAEHLLR